MWKWHFWKIVILCRLQYVVLKKYLSTCHMSFFLIFSTYCRFLACFFFHISVILYELKIIRNSKRGELKLEQSALRITEWLGWTSLSLPTYHVIGKPTRQRQIGETSNQHNTILQRNIILKKTLFSLCSTMASVKHNIY